MFLFFDWQVILDCNIIGVFLSISSAVASSEPRDYRGVFVYTKSGASEIRCHAGCFYLFPHIITKSRKLHTYLQIFK